MNKEVLNSQKIKEQGLLPLFYHDDAEGCIAVTRALYEAGIRCIEFTNRGNRASENFGLMLKERDVSFPGLLLGVGTIKNKSEANSFIHAGADFLVSPVFDSGIREAAQAHKILWIPGCLTPTEINVAQQTGCSLIKLFPGNLFGPGYIEAIMPLFTGLDFIVTGGVEPTEENINAWFKSGVTGVGLGSKLITKNIIQNTGYSGLTIKTKELMSIVTKIKAEQQRFKA
jgi:2-dehydro-3-deoxyphosphogluconate aldolase / (4S)-4-hydroxy-2-oxoglutarate aldolase